MGLRVVFMGTPDFAVPSLQLLHESQHEVVAVVTVPDKPAGRGMKIQYSPVKAYAIEQGLPILQPEKLKDPLFLAQLSSYRADLFVVVAFRMLPAEVWQMPPRGTVNLHASLLPQYRGAAPINWAIINGEKVTGVTTFFIEHQIDTGNILLSETVDIGPEETAGELHDRLKIVGAHLLLRTVDAIENDTVKPIAQNSLTLAEPLKTAPKIYKDTCRINWHSTPFELHNLIRGLSPVPGAFSYMTNGSQKWLTKILRVSPRPEPHELTPGAIVSDGKTYLRVASRGGFVEILSLQLEGKKRLPIEEFLKGFKNITQYRFES
ncbi:MAG: methionyl-tRNA formyltransferase [Bacteroidales bacterium]